MKINTLLKVPEADILKTLRGFLGKLLESQIVDYLLVPQEICHGRSLTQTLVKNLAYLDKATPFSPIMPLNSATIVSHLTADKPSRKLGVVLKPCEIRALIELTKLGQASLENLTIIGVDCPGTYEVEDYARLIDQIEGPAEKKGTQVLAKMRKNIIEQDDDPLVSLRQACQICNLPTPSGADIVLRIIGVNNGVLISLEEELTKKLGIEIEEMPYSEETISRLAKARNELRERVFTEFREKMKTITNFADYVATCIRCYACSSACPICYCRECFFRTETFEPESERYFRWAEREGALRMPTEILLFHLTRLNHVAASCVGCGMCESACPRRLPLTTIFQAVGEEVQKALGYVPGRSLKEELPIATFREREL